MAKIIFATRPSQLARWQTTFVGNALTQQWPELSCEEVVITTRGDKVLDQRVRDAVFQENTNHFSEDWIGEDDLKGFWIKVYGPSVDGEPTVREWCYPSDTKEDYTWQ